MAYGLVDHAVRKFLTLQLLLVKLEHAEQALNDAVADLTPDEMTEYARRTEQLVDVREVKK